MKFIPTAIPDVIRIEPSVFGDERGFFMETWEKRKFLDAGIAVDFVQDNHSRSAQGILRGLHYQVQQPQGKLVRVVSGAVYDVAVDLRRSSPSFGQWVGAVLSADNKHQLWVPPGFAHGFYVISEFADFVYKCTDYYAPEFERSLSWDDPELGITWPLVDGQQPRLSIKDAQAASLQTAECYP